MPAFDTKISKRSPTIARTCFASVAAPSGDRQVRFHRIRAATLRANLVDYGGGLRGSTAVVNDYLRTDSGKSLSGSATNAA